MITFKSKENNHSAKRGTEKKRTVFYAKIAGEIVKYDPAFVKKENTSFKNNTSKIDAKKIKQNIN